MEERWGEVKSTQKQDKDRATKASNSNDETVLHILVGIGENYFVNEMLSLIEDVQLPKMINLDGSTTLYIAAIVGNTSNRAID